MSIPKRTREEDYKFAAEEYLQHLEEWQEYSTVKIDFVAGARWADTPKRIIDEEPEKGEFFLEARYSYNKGYQLGYGYRDEEGYYHDVIQEMDAQILVLQMNSLPDDKKPQFVKDFNPDELKLKNGPDYWWPLPSDELLAGLSVYNGSPTDKQLNRDKADFQNLETLKRIEDEMNKMKR